MKCNNFTVKCAVFLDYLHETTQNLFCVIIYSWVGKADKGTIQCYPGTPLQLENRVRFFFLHTYPLKFDTQAFHKRNVQMIPIHLNKHKIDYVKHNELNGTKFTGKTLFHKLRNTIYLCRLQLNYESECKKLTRMKFLCCNTSIWEEKIFRFLT